VSQKNRKHSQKRKAKIMKCEYCNQEEGHAQGCPEIVTEMSKVRARREFDAGRFHAAAYFAPEEGRSDSYKLGYELAEKRQVLANC
jgi:hypothetical protein